MNAAEIDRGLAELLERARTARQQAYAPYSRFAVGAALRTASGKIYAGCNVENASYGATICAERSAIVQMVSAGERKIEAIAVVTDAEQPAMPCGICRQCLLEFGDRIAVVAANEHTHIQTTLLDLLPLPFLLERE